MGSMWLLGAVMAACGSIASNLGVNMQKYSFILNNKLPKHLQKLKTRQPKWLMGMALVILGSIGDFAALSLAAQSIVAPIGSVTLVANVFFAHYWLKESLSWVELVGTAFIVGGSVLAVAFGDHVSTSYNIHDILRFFYGTTFIVYAVLSVALSVMLYRYQLPITPIKQKIVDATKRYELAYDTNDSDAMEYEDFFIASLQREYKKFQSLHPFSLCALSGILGGQSVMFGKMVGELISTSFDGDNQFFSPFLYVFVVCMLLCVMGQLHYLAVALNFFDALYVVPVFQCFFISFSTLGGACFFNEFAGFEPAQAVLFPIGLLTTLAGVLVLSRRKMSDGSENRKRLLSIVNDSGMEIIEEGDEDEENDDATDEEAEGTLTIEQARAATLVMLETKRRRFRRARKHRLRKMGYEGLSDDEDEGDEGEDDEMDAESFINSDEEMHDESTAAPTIELESLQYPQAQRTPRKISEEKKEELQIPTTRQSPIHPAAEGGHHRRRSSLASTPTPAHPSLLDELGAALTATAGSSPGQSPRMSPTTPVVDGRRQSVGGTPQGRRRSIDRRVTLPRLSRVPPALSINPDAESSSAPTTPTSGMASFVPSIFRAMSATPSLAATPSLGPSASPAAPGETPSFLQPSTATYIRPPAPIGVFSKETTIDEKVKKYSSLPYHAGGLVGMPLASALGHLITVVKEDRNTERKEQEEKAPHSEQSADASAVAIDVNEGNHALTVPVAEAVSREGASRTSSTEPTMSVSGSSVPHHHHHSMSILDAVKAFGSNAVGKIRHALGDKESEEPQTADTAPLAVLAEAAAVEAHDVAEQELSADITTPPAESTVNINEIDNEPSQSQADTEQSIVPHARLSEVNESQIQPSLNSSVMSNIEPEDSSLDSSLNLDDGDSDSHEDN